LFRRCYCTSHLQSLLRLTAFRQLFMLLTYSWKRANGENPTHVRCLEGTYNKSTIRHSLIICFVSSIRFELHL
jgi:hypothetical protein